jgi:glycogen phosphorylase
VAIHLNDTHPAIGVAELMRLLVDEHGLPWADAWRLTQQVFSYTNHTLMPEALETWPVALMQRVLPRHLEIILRINHDFLAWRRARRPGDAEFLRRLSLIDESGERRVRMATCRSSAATRSTACRRCTPTCWCRPSSPTSPACGPSASPT